MSNLQIAITWTLIHSIWEAGVVAAGVVLVVGAVRSSSVRYAVACAGLLGIAGAFVATFVYLFPWSPAVVRSHALHVPEFVSGVAIPFMPAGMAKRFSIPDVLPWIGRLWFVGFAMFNLRHLANWVATRRMRTRGVCLAPEAWQERVKRASARLRVSKPVMLFESCLVRVPVVTGQIRPMILVPIGVMAGLSVEQIELILMHELAHVRRHDYLVNMLQTFVEGLMFYNPAVWWISSVIRREREHCCDDMVVAATHNALAYAGALAALEETRGSHGELAIASTGGSLVKRINRLLRQPDVRGFTLMPLVTSSVLIAVAAVVLAARPVPLAARVEPVASARIPAVAAVQQPSTAGPVGPAQTPPVLPPPESAPSRSGHASNALKKWIGQDVAFLTSPAQPAQVPNALMRWLNEDVLYIITDEERKAFLDLTNDREREQFIEQFWQRRDPTPGTIDNEYKDEHYARIAWANERFATKTGGPGWKTDRGRISIKYGKPDELETHPAGGQYTRPDGVNTLTSPFEVWRYKYIEGVGSNIILQFVDTTSTGDFRLSPDPTAQRRIGLLQGTDKPTTSYDRCAVGAVYDRAYFVDFTKIARS